MRVDVYRNLHKNKFSIRALDGPKRGLVIAHAENIILKDVKFIVQPAGRERVLREKRKNVHAFARGKRTRIQPEDIGERVYYNPYKADYFFLENGEKIETAKYVTLDIFGEKAIMRAWS